MNGWTRWGLMLAGLVLISVPEAHAEYRAYELEVVDIFECRINKRERCRSSKVLSSLSPNTYARTHGGTSRIAVMMLATWMCWGDTSNYRAICPRPAPRNAKFSVGGGVRIKLEKHITDGWNGTVEIAYYQQSISSNVYGVRFASRQNVYARYFEKDLVAAAQTGGASPPATPGGGAETPGAQEAEGEDANAAGPIAPGAAPAGGGAPATPPAGGEAAAGAPAPPTLPAAGGQTPQAEPPQ